MDCAKVGKLILDLRKEKKMTQKELADKMNISDRTISKWERGIGCPDVSLLNELSAILEVNIEKILSGNLEQKNKDSGNIKKAKFYVCANCSNTFFSTREADIYCCGRKLLPLVIKTQQDENSLIRVEEIENDYYVTINHEMSKTHYVSFIVYITYDKVLFIKLYPEQPAEARFPKMQGGKVYACCNQHGLWGN